MSIVRRFLAREPLSTVQVRNRLFLLGMLFIFLGYAFWIDPLQTPIQPCYFKVWTGWDCPSCGMSRSLHALTHGQWLTAVDFHWMGPVLFAMVIFMLFGLVLELALRKKITVSSRWLSVKNAALLFLTIWLVTWLVRLAGVGHG